MAGRLGLGRAFALLAAPLALLLGWCVQPRPSKAPAHDVEPPEVLFSGCEEITLAASNDLRCWDPSGLRIWARVEGDELELRVDGVPLEPKPNEDGFSWKIPDSVHRVELQWRAESHWRLDVEHSTSGDAGPPSAEAGECGALRAQADAAHDADEAERLLRRTIECAQSAGLVSTGHRARNSLSFRLREAGRLTSALDVLEGAESHFGSANVRRSQQHHRALALRDLGRLTEAAKALDEADFVSRRVASAEEQLGSIQAALPVAIRLGRLDEAEAMTRRLLSLVSDVDSEAQAIAFTNLVWTAIMDQERVEPFGPASSLPEPKVAWPDPGELQRAALSIAADEAAPARHANRRLNLAIAEARAGKIEEARSILTTLDAEGFGAEGRLWFALTDARLQRAEGRTRSALASLVSLRDRVATIGFIDFRWRVQVELGITFEALGQNERALAAYGEAEDIVEEIVELAPAQRGRSLQLSALERSSRALFDLALRTDRLELAERVARRARVRAWASLALQTRINQLSESERERLDLKIEDYVRTRVELAALQAREPSLDGATFRARRMRLEAMEVASKRTLATLLRALGAGDDGRSWLPSRHAGADDLVVFPGRTDWWAVLRRGGRFFEARLARLADVSDVPEALARFVVSAPGPEAERLRLMPHRSLEAIDLHRDLVGQPSLPSELEYAVDLEEARQPSGWGEQVLIVDAAGDLVETQRETEAIRRSHEAAGRRVRVMRGDDLNLSMLLTALPGVDVFHFSGHAAARGSDLEPGLILSEGEHLEPADVLSLPSGPRWVMLSACETADFEPRSDSLNIDLAKAFILRGAQSVVATQRPVKDELAADLGIRAHAHPSALRKGFLARLEELEAQQEYLVDWAAFRLVVR